MDDLMKELENIVLKDIQDECEDEGIEKQEITDWEMITKIKKGTDKINNFNISLLENLNLENHIFKEALEYYNTTIKQNYKRSKFKSAVMCACVFLAFSNNNDFREEKSLMEYFNINKVKYTKGLKMVKTCVTEIRYIKNSFDNELFSFCKELDTIDDVKNISIFIEENIQIAMETLSQSSIRMLNCSLIYVWLFKNKKIIPTIESFSRICKISDKTLNRTLYKISFLFEDFVQDIIDKQIEDFSNEIETKIKIKTNIKSPCRQEIKTMFKKFFVSNKNEN